MEFSNGFDALILITLSVCVVVWPTQWISDRQNTWLRAVTVVLVAVHLLFDGPRMQLIGAYAVAVLFLLLFIPRGQDRSEPSSVRESKESATMSSSRWALVILSGACIALSIGWCWLSPR